MERDKNGRFAKKIVKFEGLPEKWCIDRQKYPEVAKWFNEHNESGNRAYDREEYAGWMTHHPAYPIRSHSSNIVQKGYTEITIDQFRKCVLKQEEKPIPEKWSINIPALTNDQKKVVGEFFTKHSGHACYGRSLQIWRRISSHNLTNEYILDKKNGKVGSFADCKEFEYITFEQFEKYVMKKEEKKMYTVQELFKEGNVVYLVNKEEHAQLLKVIKGTPHMTGEGLCDWYGAYCYNLSKDQYSSNSSKVNGGVYEPCTIITFDQIKFEEEKKMEKKHIGYKLIKEYPTGDDRFKLGFIVPSTKYGEGGWGSMHETCEKYPEFWERVYQEEYAVGSFIYIDNSNTECYYGCQGVGNGIHEIVAKDSHSINGLLNDEPWTIKVKGPNGIWKIAPATGKSFRLATKKEIEDWNSPKITIGGYDSRFDFKEGIVRFGCQAWKKEEVAEFVKVLNKSGLVIETYHEAVLSVHGQFLKHK